MRAGQDDASRSCSEVDSWQHQSAGRQKTTGLPAYLHSTYFKMLLALFLFLNRVAAQEPQAGLVEKLDKLLAGQEKQRTLEFASTLANNDISWYKDIISKIAEKIAESDQTLVDGLNSIILEVQSVELILQAAIEFNKTLNQLQYDI